MFGVVSCRNVVLIVAKSSLFTVLMCKMHSVYIKSVLCTFCSL